MDLSLTITPTTIINREGLLPGHWLQALQYRSPDKETHQSRGELFALLSLSCPDKELDLENLARQAFAALTQTYFKTPEGSIISALDNGLRQTQENINLLVQKPGGHHVKFNLATAVIWGDILYFRRLEQTIVALLRGGELISYSFTSLGSEKLSGGDAIVVCTTDFWEKIGHQELARVLTKKPADEWENLLGEKIHACKDNSLMGTIILSIEQRHVPSEEEIIDIGVVGERSKENFLPAFVNKIRGLKLPLPAISFKLPKLFFPASKIFLKRPSLTKRSQKVALTSALGVLLLTAVVSTHLYRTRVHEHQQQSALLAQVKELLAQGQAVSSQDPQAATQYYRSAGDILGQITQNKQAQELSDELERTLALAYNLQAVTTQKAEGWPEIISKQIFELQADGIHALGDRGAILASDPAWQSITAIDGFGAAYGENLYLLDIQANQIHKYIALSTGYSRRFDYFTISVDLSQATDLAIDGAIYVLLNNGEVHKYLGGEKQDFRLSGFYPPIANAQAIFTTPEIEHIYVASENMILVFDKGGKYQKGFELNEQFGGHLLISDNEEALWFGKEDNIYTADLR